MKKVLLLTLIAVAAIAFSLNSAMALPVAPGDQIKINAASYSGAGGGEFEMQNAANQTLFISFCIEKDEFLSLGVLYTVDTISKEAVQGGVGGGSPDPISGETAWLYSNFVAGTLAGYSKFSATQGQNALQDAIWMYENEIGVTSNYFYDLAAGKSADNVWAVNLKDAAGNDHQSILVTPEPFTMLLLGLGLVGLAGLRRKE